MTVSSRHTTLLIHSLCFGILFFLLSLGNSYQKLDTTSKRIQEDIVYHDGVWDTTSYNGDPLLSGSSTIYILASDGFVIERWKPISGFLDASDFKHLLAFREIQTIQTISKQDWRIFSTPIEKDGETYGVVTVSSYHPIPEILQTFDKQMKEVSEYLLAHVQIENNSIHIQDLDQRKFPYYVSFQIVNKYNKIVLKGNNTNSIDRLPNFIDPSYVATQLQSLPVGVIRDAKSGSLYLIHTQPLTDENGQSKGVIVVGENLQFLLTPFFSFIGIVILFIALSIAWRILKNLVEQRSRKEKKTTISFDGQNSIIRINAGHVSIPYASNQYYLCQAIIQHPKKRWEMDELLEKFGEESHPNSWRKIYDSMNQVNKKVFPILKKKLIVLDKKTYRFNPDIR